MKLQQHMTQNEAPRRLTRLLLPLLPMSVLGLSLWSPVSLADCNLALSSPSIDFGTLNRSTLTSLRGEMPLGERRLSINVSCDQPSDMTLFYRATAKNTDRLRLGDLASYSMQVRSVILDGSAMEAGQVAAPGEIPSKIAEQMVWQADHGIVPVSAGAVQQGRNLQVLLDVKGWTEAAALRLRDETQWQADGLFELTSPGLSQELSVRANTLPVSCVPTLSGGGEVNFGTINAQRLERNAETPLAPRTLELMINCDARVHIALATLDNRNSAAIGFADTDFGLGVDGGNNQIGRYTVSVDNVRVDALASAYLTESGTGGSSWSPAQAGAMLLSKRSWLGFSDTSGSTAGTEALERLQATLSIAPVIAPATTLELSEAVELDGALTIEIKYL